MARKRERLEVIKDLLVVVRDRNNSVRPTPLLRQSNLSSKSFLDYYQELLEKGLVKEILDRHGRKYVTLTDKGFTYLERYQLIHDFIDEFGL
jgi:predicted transcriptional regulator